MHRFIFHIQSLIGHIIFLVCPDIDRFIRTLSFRDELDSFCCEQPTTQEKFCEHLEGVLRTPGSSYAASSGDAYHEFVLGSARIYVHLYLYLYIYTHRFIFHINLPLVISFFYFAPTSIGLSEPHLSATSRIYCVANNRPPRGSSANTWKEFCEHVEGVMQQALETPITKSCRDRHEFVYFYISLFLSLSLYIYIYIYIVFIYFVVYLEFVSVSYNCILSMFV